jgi:tetratricopeptide (TPR) repeat protein
MLADPILTKALSLTRRGKYDDSIRLLEREVFRYQDSYSYYYIFALSCLYSGETGDAFAYFNRAKNIKKREVSPLLGLAALFLRRAETDRALDLYLEVQDIEPKNRIAKKALTVIRKYGGTEDFNTWLNQDKLRNFYPPLPRAGISVKPLPFIIAGIIIAAVTGIIIGYKKLPVLQRNGMQQSGLQKTDLENPVETGGVYRYIFTVGEVVSQYNKARRLFNDHHDEAAKRELNRIIDSNASAAVKSKARLLFEYMEKEPPGFDTIKDKFSYAEVSADPLLYRDCYVLWRGSVANVKMFPDSVVFDFLVGYDTRTVMEGAVTVEIDFPAEINPAEAMEVLGKVMPLSQGKFKLKGTGLHTKPGN